MRTKAALWALSLFALAGCEPGPRSEKGFRLPDGDAAQGTETFLALKCNACHRVHGVDLPPPPEGTEPVVLGGGVPRIKTYGELVTMIINPSHSLAGGHLKGKIARNGMSKMPVYNDTMTVTQLSNLVAFLQARYEIKRDDDLYYPYFGP